MASLPPLLRGRSRLLAPLIAVIAVGFVVAGLVVSFSGKYVAKLPTGKNTAEPAALVNPGDPAPPQSRRHNVVMILADDMRADDLRWMPAVRHLIEDRGLDFRNSFSTNPLCAPARASLLSGDYSQNTGVFSVSNANGFHVFNDRSTIATSLNAAGYNTLMIGKYMNGYGVDRSKVTRQISFKYVPPGWTDWNAAVTRPKNSGYASGGTYNYFHLMLSRNGRIDDSHRGQYSTDVIGTAAQQLVRKYHRSPKPFFLYFAPVAPHFGSPREKDDPMHMHWPNSRRKERIETPARPKWVWGRFDRQIRIASGLPTNGGPSERNISDKPRAIRNLPELDRQERAAVLNSTRQRAEALFVLDRQVARLVATLKQTGEYANTDIMFTSDNGYFLGEHRIRQGKIRPHDPSLRVPFLVSGPGIPHGTRYDPITTEDISATILAIAGASPPHPADGASLVPTFRRDRGWRAPVVTEGHEASRIYTVAARHPASGFDDLRTTIGIRTNRWLYVRYNTGEGELYDLVHDPNEMRSVFGNPRYRAVQARLQRVWLLYKDCAGSACRRPMPAGLQASPHQEQVWTDRESRGVQARYGYYR